MSWKSLTCVTLFCALLAGQALAVPTIQVAGVENAGNVDWTVSFTPDPTLLAGGEGSLGIELALEFSETLLNDAVNIEPDFDETINDTPIENPGLNPYINDITEGVTTHPGVTSVMGNPGTVNAIFAALGSTKFTTNGSKLALSFTTVGTTGKVTWDGFIAQDADGDLVEISGMLEVGGGGGLEGDTNNDGVVDLQDLFNVQNNFGLPSPPNLGDTDGDMDIDLQDLFNVQNNFGNTAGALAVSPSQVPEPSTMALVSLCGLGGLLIASKRRK